jgi:hypothetical protein
MITEVHISKLFMWGRGIVEDLWYERLQSEYYVD